MIADEFSRPVEAMRLGGEERLYDIVATADERLALARRFGILSVETLSATVRLRRLGGVNLFRLSGSLVADVLQACVVTLVPVPQHIEEEFVMTFTTDDAGDGDEVVIELNAEDPPDLIENGVIDMGEAVAEHLALALDPFPRAPGAEFVAEEAPEEPPEPRKNPFEALAEWKKK
jgi:uncharacterized metal-binding protein YceD (DUF177 family)